MITKNAVYCPKCEVEIESKHRHDFVWCPGRHIAVDGGKSYLKRTGDIYSEELERSTYSKE